MGPPKINEFLKAEDEKYIAAKTKDALFLAEKIEEKLEKRLQEKNNSCL